MATTTTPSKTIGATAVSWTNGDLASAAQYISAAIDVSAKFAVAFQVQVGRRTGTAFTAGWPVCRIEGSGKASGNDAWSPIVPIVPPVGASIANTTLNGAVSAGATTALMTAATNMAAGDILYLGHTSDPTKYELVRFKSLSGSTVTFEEACTYAHDTGAMVTDQGEQFFVTVDCSAISRVRVVIDNSNSGQAVAFQVLYNLLDSLGTA